MHSGSDISPDMPWWLRPRVWAVTAIAVLLVVYVATLGAAGPWDPWETHYGEVARQILVRHDPIDLYWRPGNGGHDGSAEKYFWSKPALPFWAMALSMKVFGVGMSPDPAEMVQPWIPELAIRMPSLLAGFGTAIFLGWVVWRLVSPRAGVLAGLVLGTMPQFAIVTRQALTDMFFVGPLVLALGAWAMAWCQPDRELRTRGKGLGQIPWDRAYVAFFVFFVIAVVAPLAVMHQHSFDPITWKRIGDSKKLSANMHQIQQHLFIYWALVVVVVVRSLRWRKRSQAWMGILYIAGGLALIGKGMIGPGIIGLCVLVHLIVSGRWGLLRRCGLPTGVLFFILAGFPWHHALILYRGEKFVDEWIVTNNLARFSSGEQKQAVGSFEYYLETLGPGALPWSALSPIALWAGVRAFVRRGKIEAEPEQSEGEDTGEGEGDATPEPEPDDETRDPALAMHRFAVVWLVATLFILSFAVTKYYHYLLPVLPPLAVMIGIWLDDALAKRHVPSRGGTAVLVLTGIAILYGVVRDLTAQPAWLAHLTTYSYTGTWARGGPDPTLLAYTSIPFALGLAVWLLWRQKVAVAVALFVLSAGATTTWVVNDYLPAASEDWSQRTMMRIYFAERGPKDRIVSWWFYYRGETFLTKRNIHVMKKANRKQLSKLTLEFAEARAGEGASLWFCTLSPNAKRLRGQLPMQLRGGLEVKHEGLHYTLMRLPFP